MTSFSCPHFDMDHERCLRLKAECVPGRPGCVLTGNSVFATPVAVRLREKREEQGCTRDRPDGHPEGASG